VAVDSKPRVRVLQQLETACCGGGSRGQFFCARATLRAQKPRTKRARTKLQTRAQYLRRRRDSRRARARKNQSIGPSK
jgi:hypothetical protein